MSLIQTFPDGGGGGSNIPNGSTITPTDDIQIWLKCAELTESYTTLNEVLADDDIMEKLFRSENASDYLVRSTTWANDITANQTAMILIGANDYCANKLLDDSTWSAAICNSTYFESVLNIKVPTLSSSSDKVIKSGENGTNYAWQAFDNNNETRWFNSQSTNDIYIGYDFTNQIKCYKAVIYTQNASTSAKIYTEKIEGSNDGTNWSNIFDTTVNFSGSEFKNLSYIFANNNYRYIRYKNYTENSGVYVAELVYTLQFYGRATKTTIYSAANDIVSFIDDEGAKVVITDATGKGETTIVCKPNTDITFTSSVAKDPNNLNENYSKVVTVKTGEPVFVMPNKNVLYWYGYKGNNFEVLSTANGWSASSPYNPEFYPPTENANFIRCYHSSSLDGKIEGIGTKNSIITTKIHGIIKGYNLVSFYGGYASYASKQITNTNTIDGAQITNSEMKHLEFDFSTTAKYAVFSSTNNRGMDVYAFWYDDTDDDSKAEISAIGTNEDKPTASRDYTVGEHFYKNGKFCTCTQAIASGAIFTLGTNYIEGDIAGSCVRMASKVLSNVNINQSENGWYYRTFQYTHAELNIPRYAHVFGAVFWGSHNTNELVTIQENIEGQDIIYITIASPNSQTSITRTVVFYYCI